MSTQTTMMIVIAALVVIALGLFGWLAILQMRSQRLKKKFGQEYDYTLEKTGDRRKAEQDLKDREKQVVSLDIHPLDNNLRDRYHHEWTEIQADFVDDPTKSVERGNRLITEVMIARGFPVADMEQRTDYLSVMYPNLVPKYREANTIATKSQQGTASTEELRKAMVDYHMLFDKLLDTVHTQEKVMEPAS